MRSATVKEEPSVDLPEPYMLSEYRSIPPRPPLALYTADQMRAAILAERERCARLCDEINRNDTTCMGDSADLRKFAAAIRGKKYIRSLDIYE
jgi:hypothetical protein